MCDRNESGFRSKVIWFSFIFSLLVIWVHSYNAELYLGQTPEMEWVYRVEHWLGDWIAQIAVPGFFMISGYLFYRDFTWKKLREKWNRRIQSILVPYILWNFLYYLGYVIGSRIPWMTDVMGKGVVPWNIQSAVNAVINHTYNYVFWYLFQLILLILLAPVLYLVLKKMWSRTLFFGALCGLLICDIRLPLLNADALFYYSAAAALGLSPGMRKIIEQPEGRKCGGLLVLGAGFVYWYGLSHGWTAAFVLCRFLAVSGLWLFVSSDHLPKVREFMRYNFFLYAVHFAVVRFINKAGADLFLPTPAVPLILFFIMPILALLVSTAVGKILRRLSPAVWMLLNGAR